METKIPSTLDRILLVGQRAAWTCPIRSEGPKFYFKRARKYGRERSSNYDESRSFSDAAFSVDMPQSKMANVTAESMANRLNQLKPKVTIGYTTIKPNSEDVTQTDAAHRAPNERSQSALMSQLESHAAYLSELVSLTAKHYTWLETWASMSFESKHDVLSAVYERKMCTSSTYSVCICLLSLFLQPFCTNSLKERSVGRFNLDAVLGRLKNGQLDAFNVDSIITSLQQSKQFTVQQNELYITLGISLCREYTSISALCLNQFLLFVFDAVHPTSNRLQVCHPSIYVPLFLFILFSTETVGHGQNLE